MSSATPTPAAQSGCQRESSSVISQRVEEARERSGHRWAAAGLGGAVSNATIPGRLLRHQWCADLEGMVALQELVRCGEISQRGVDRALRVAWTLADLDGKDRPSLANVMDAAELYADSANLAIQG